METGTNLIGLIIILTLIVGLIITAITTLYLNHKEKINSPQYKCLHELETIKTRDGVCTEEYLSTCKKCGYQKYHLFCGNN